MTSKITIDELARALANDEFVYYHQPKVSMVTGKVCGSEALIRWQQADGTLIPPGDFIPLAESTGFISEITLHMLDKLYMDNAILRDVDPALITSFNVSAKDFMTSTLVDALYNATDAHEVDPSSIQVEITETVMLDNCDSTAVNMKRLEQLGVTLAMDDFGTGFSSLDMLSKWPFSAVKLDQGVISRMQGSEKNKTIAESSIHMAHDLGLEVVAEGIESEDIYMFLQNSGCTIAQGYWISRPISLEGFLAFLGREKRWPAMPIGLFYMAQLDHIHWRKRLMEAIYFGRFDAGNTANESLWHEPELDHTRCRLGTWYYGEGRKFAGNAWYDNLEEPHQELHLVGRQLLEMAARDESQDKLVNMMRTLSKLSARLIRNLQELENAEMRLLRQNNPLLAEVIHLKDLHTTS